MFEDEREAGPVHVGHQMWRLLHMDTILADAGLSRRAQLVTEVMTLNRLVHPAAERRRSPIAPSVTRGSNANTRLAAGAHATGA